MRVCQILASVEEGGLEKHTIELSNELAKKGIDITLSESLHIWNIVLEIPNKPGGQSTMTFS